MKFAIVSDVHFGPAAYHEGKLRKLTHHAEQLVQRFVAYVNEQFEPALVINMGDVIEDETRARDRENYQRFLQALTPLRAPVLHVAGNHDTINLSADDLLALWGQSGELHYARDVGGVHFSVLHTQETKDVAVHLPDAQLAWLERDLEQTSLPVVLLMHHPASEMQLSGNRWFEKAPQICRVAERRKLRRVLESSGKVVAVFNGHVHWNHFDVISGIPYITLQSLVENLDDDAPGRAASAFATCTLDEHRLVITVHGEETLRYQIELPRS